MAAVELAQGYVSLTVSTEGMGRDIAKQFGGVQKTADKAGKEAGKKFGGGFGSSFKGVLGGAAVLGGLAKIGGFLKSSVGGASDLNETLSKSSVIFGKNAATIDAFARGASKSLGLSREAALAAAASFGDMFTQIGFTGKEAAKASKSTLQMAADLGSFSNLETGDVLDRISGALRGEYDSLQAVIPNINAARVEKEAMAATGVKNAKSLTAEQKAQAVLNIIQKDGAKAAGDFAKTSGGLANQQKILSAQFTDIKATVGGALVPTLASAAAIISGKVAPAIAGFITGMQNGTGAGGEFASVLKTVAKGFADAGKFIVKNRDVLIPLVAGVLAGVAAFKIIIAAQWAWNAAMTANPIGIVVVAIAALVAGLIYAYKHSETFRKVVNAAFTGVKTVVLAVVRWLTKAIPAVVNWIKKTWDRLPMILTAPFRLARDGIKTIWAAIKGTFIAFNTFLVTVFKKWWAALPGMLLAPFRLARDGIRAGWTAIMDKFRAVNTWLFGTFKKAWGGLKAMLLAPIYLARDAIRSVFAKDGPIRGAFANAITAIGNIWDGLKKKAAAPVNFVIGTVYNNGLRKALNLIPGVELAAAPLIKFAVGGAVRGPGSGTADRIPAMLSNGEHVFTAAEVKAAGGHGRIEELRAALRNGMPAFATGGRVNFKGGTFTENFARRLKSVNSRFPFNIFQGGFRPSTSYSGTSHQGDAVDLGPVSAALVKALRAVRIAAWDRTGMGNWAPHIHGVPLPGAGRAAGSAIWQAKDYLAGGNGLGGRDNGAGSGGASPKKDSGGSFPVGPTQPELDQSKGSKIFATLKGHLAGMPKGGWWDVAKSAATSVIGTAKEFFSTKIKAAIAKAKETFGGIGDSLTGKGIGTTGSNQELGKRMMLAAGFKENQWAALRALWIGESGWRTTANNPSSGAYGIPQSLPGSKMASSGSDWKTNPATQIDWGLKYIKERYGSPMSAYRNWQGRSPHWYDNGGMLKPGLNLAYNGTKKPERVLTDKQWKSLSQNSRPQRVTNINGDIYTVDAKQLWAAQLEAERRQEALHPTWV